MADTAAAQHEDVRHDDLEFDVDIQPAKKAKAWLNRLEESEDAFDRLGDPAAERAASTGDTAMIRWLLCRFRWCGGVVDYDATGSYWKCARCGKVTR